MSEDFEVKYETWSVDKKKERFYVMYLGHVNC